MCLRPRRRATMLDSVRTRLTLWYVGVLALVLVSFSITVYALLARNIYARLDDDLSTTLQETGFSLGRRAAPLYDAGRRAGGRQQPPRRHPAHHHARDR